MATKLLHNWVKSVKVINFVVIFEINSAKCIEGAKFFLRNFKVLEARLNHERKYLELVVGGWWLVVGGW